MAEQTELWERILLYGLMTAGLSEQRVQRLCMKTKDRLFHDNFGVGPKAIAAAYTDLVTTTLPEARVDDPDMHWFLVLVYWLKVYLADGQMYSKFGSDKDLMRTNIKFYVDKLAALKGIKIVWNDLTKLPEIFALSVDGVHFMRNEPRTDPSVKHFSQKSNGAGLAYEIGLLIWRNQIAWIDGPFEPGELQDKTKYEEPGGLQSLIPYGKLVIADRGYRGESTESGQYRTLSIRNTCDTEEVKQFKRRCRARHENVNARFKNFKILESRFRHGDRHQACLMACAVLVQYDMENGSPLFDV